MKYQNPRVPEGINATSEHPLREFAWLGAGTLAAIAIAVLILTALADLAAPLVPFEWEQRLAGAFVPAADDLDEKDRAATSFIFGLVLLAAKLTSLPPGFGLARYELSVKIVSTSMSGYFAEASVPVHASSPNKRSPSRSKHSRNL